MKKDNVKIMDTFESYMSSIEVVECVCGYHMGVDSTYLEQVGGVTTKCPSCGFKIIYGYEEDIDE